MNDIKTAVNLATYAVAVVVWIVILVMYLLGQTIPPDVKNIFLLITGVIIGFIQAFEKGYSFTGVTETTSSTKTTSTTDATKGVNDAKVNPDSPLSTSGL